MPVNKDALKRYRIIDRLLSNPNRDYTTDLVSFPKWLHSTQIELDEETQFYFRSKYPTLSDCVFFSIECRENNELYTRFASYCENIVLVEPIYMRERLKQKMMAAATNYSSF